MGVSAKQWVGRESRLDGRSFPARDAASTERQAGLVRRYLDGDGSAGDELIRLHSGYIRRLAVSIVRARNLPADRIDDLYQEGCLAMIAAAPGYDPSRGTSFLTYAAYWIKQAVCRSDESVLFPCHLPAHVRESKAKVSSGQAGDLTESRLKCVGQASAGFTLLSELKANGGDIAARPDADGTEFPESIRSGLHRAVMHLTDPEWDLISRRLGLAGDPPATFTDIAKSMGEPHQRIGDRYRLAVIRLRSLLAEEIRDPSANRVAV